MPSFDEIVTAENLRRARHFPFSSPLTWFSDFKFHLSAIKLESAPHAITASGITEAGSADFQFDAVTGDWKKPLDSAFPNLEKARTFLKYQPLGLSVNHETMRLKLAEVMRDEKDWEETCLKVNTANFAFLGHFNCTLELATRIAPIDYQWRLGRKIRLAPESLPRHRLTSIFDEALSA